MSDVISNWVRPPRRWWRRWARSPRPLCTRPWVSAAPFRTGSGPCGPRALCGPALTVECRPGDNLMPHKAVSLAQRGDVLVVDNGGYLEGGLWGEIITVAAMQRGILDLVTNGAVRDTVAIRGLGFPVFCAGVSIK